MKFYPVPLFSLSLFQLPFFFFVKKFLNSWPHLFLPKYIQSKTSIFVPASSVSGIIKFKQSSWQQQDKTDFEERMYNKELKLAPRTQSRTR